MDIIVKNLKKNYYLEGQTIEVLRGIDLSIKSGEFVSLTGASGVGKSTLLHIMGTLDVPTEGQVVLGGVDVFAQPSAKVSDFRNENIGFVFQFHHLLPEFTALENVSVPLYVRRESTEHAKRKAKELLDLVGLSHRMDHKPGELSGGEQQRVALARALVGEPKLLLADEPTGNLDEQTGASILDVIKELNRNMGITTLVVTHNLRLAKEAPRRLVLEETGISESK